MGILGSPFKMGYKLGKDKRYKRMGLMGVTTEVQSRGKYETPETSATLLTERCEGSQSKQTTRDVDACQC